MPDVTHDASAADLLGDLCAAVEDFVQEDAGGVWREDPVSLEEFVTSSEHLGLPPLYPVQAALIAKLLGTDPKRTFADPLREPEELRRQYQEAVACWGKGSGKDYVCSIVVCYLVHVLLCLRDPQAYLELAPGENIDLVNVAYNSDQAKKVFFAKLKARIERWEWLTQRANIVEGGRRRGRHVPGRPTVAINDDSIEFPRGIRAWSRHAQNEAYEGLNVIAWVMDEASAFLSKAKRENAEAIYSTLRTSARSRFGSRWLGFVISFPRHGDDFTMTKLKEAKDRPELGVLADGPRSTWEVNERTRDEPRHRVRGIEVPLSLANDFESDFEDALSKYRCEPPMAREAFFRFPEDLRAAVMPGRRPLVEWERTLVERTDGDSGQTRSYVGVRLTRLGDLPPGVKLYVHGDPGLVSDSFALAIAHASPATVMQHLPAAEVLNPVQLREWTDQGNDPTALVEWEVDVVRAVVDALIVWRPDPRRGHQVDLQSIEDTIFELKERYPSIGHYPRKRHGESQRLATVTFDHWNSALTVQRMRARRMNVAEEAWTRDFQVAIYRNARAMFANGLVSLPDTPSITSPDPADRGALFELERIEFQDAVKIDHPSGGSKDSADAVVRVIQHASEHGRASGMAFGSVSRPGVERPPQGVGQPPEPSQHLREREESERRERPLGELTPGKARSSGGLVFGSLYGGAHRGTHRGAHGQLRGERQEFGI